MSASFSFDAANSRLLTSVRCAGLGVNALRHDARKAIDLSAAQRLRIIDGLADAILELGNAIRMAGDAALAGVPIARGQVEENLGETVGVSAARQCPPSPWRRGRDIQRRESQPWLRRQSGRGKRSSVKSIERLAANFGMSKSPADGLLRCGYVTG